MTLEHSGSATDTAKDAEGFTIKFEMRGIPTENTEEEEDFCYVTVVSELPKDVEKYFFPEGSKSTVLDFLELCVDLEEIPLGTYIADFKEFKRNKEGELASCTFSLFPYLH